MSFLSRWRARRHDRELAKFFEELQQAVMQSGSVVVQASLEVIDLRPKITSTRGYLEEVAELTLMHNGGAVIFVGGYWIMSCGNCTAGDELVQILQDSLGDLE